VNVGSLLDHHARYRPERAAVVCGPHRLTFREHQAGVNRLANALASLGLRRGDALAIALPNGLALLETYRAAARLGLVAVPLSPLLRGEALAALAADAGAAGAIVAPSFRDALADRIPRDRTIVAGASYDTLVAAASPDAPPAVEIGDEDIYNIIYSSGTTGHPKGIVHTHRIRALYGALFAAAFRFTPESVCLHAGSLVFNGAFVTLMPTWLTGCTYVLMEQFDAATFIETVEREQVTHVMMVPSQIVAVLHAPNFSARAVRSLRMVCSVGAPWHREHKERMLAALPDSCYELYGLTEGFITILDSRDFAAHLDSVGVPIPYSDMRIVDDAGRDVASGQVGEIVGRSPLLMPGYHHRPDLTAQAIVDGWLFTGDLGYVDADGFLHLADRKKDLIISGGVNVYPKDIEEIAAQHPAIREVAVFGVPDDRWGESPVAATVLKTPGEAGAESLRAWINARVGARYQQVREVVIVGEFPRSAAGKTLKRELRARYLETT